MPRLVLHDSDDTFLPQAVELHYQALSYRSFITMFGRLFLYRLYREWLRSGLAFLVIAHEEDRLRGFILGCHDSSRLMSVVWRRPWLFAPLILRVLARRPSLIPRLFETLLYGRRESCRVSAELVVIAVQPETRSQGLGRELLGELDRELSRAGAEAYKVTVHREMEASNRFYAQNGFELHHRFRLYGVEWNLYLRRIGRPGEDGA